MKTEKVLLSQVKVNEANPRTITERKLQLLVDRLLAFPKMIELRPVVVDETLKALGGNMRTRAYNFIAGLPIEHIAARLAATKNYQRMTKAEQQQLLQYWQKWLDKPTVEIAKASTLTEAEKKEFIIADNASFGEWDYDKLANEWESEDLVSWGLDVWSPEPPMGSSGNSPAGSTTPSTDVTGGGTQFDPSGLPAELQGQDINPDDLPKIEGSNEVAMERIIIVYPKEKAGALAAILGLESIDKVVYNIDEVLGEAGE